MSDKRIYALSIAGLDPSAGAGLLADIKTFQAFGVYGLGICSGLTIQHESRFDNVEWIDMEIIREQLMLIAMKYPIDVVKVGLIESLDSMLELVTLLKQVNPSVKIIWDPVVRASAGFRFHTDYDSSLLENILR